MQKHYWKGISHDDRTKAISDITSIAGRNGTILNFQRFSDIILSLVIEIEPGKIQDFYHQLMEILYLEGFDNTPSGSSDGEIVMLNITFARGTGDLEIEVPDLPE
jgi:hypothetical protein